MHRQPDLGIVSVPETVSIRTGSFPQFLPTVRRSSEKPMFVFSHFPQAVTSTRVLEEMSLESSAVKVTAANSGEVLILIGNLIPRGAAGWPREWGVLKLLHTRAWPCTTRIHQPESGFLFPKWPIFWSGIGPGIWITRASHRSPGEFHQPGSSQSHWVDEDVSKAFTQ